MRRQPSMKIELKSSLEAEPRTLSNNEYELALEALRAYVNGNIEDETDALFEDMKAAEGNPPLPKATKDGAGPSTVTSTSSSTETSTSTSTETSTSASSTTGSGSGSGTAGKGSGSDRKLPALD